MASDLSSPNYGSAIASVESGGRYDILGPETKGDRAYGKYQIMGQNIGPWSKEVLGQEVTPEQFLANPQLQDAIFQGKFGQYVDKYGPEGAAKAWFAGEKGMNNPNAKDSLGTTVSGYGAKFMKALGAPQAPAMTQGGPPVPVLSSTLPAYGFTPNNAPAGISGAQSSPAMAEMAPQPQAADPMEALGLHSQMLGGAPRRPPDLTQLRALLSRPGPSRGFSFSRT